jgi:hypothetical protein
MLIRFIAVVLLLMLMGMLSAAGEDTAVSYAQSCGSSMRGGQTVTGKISSPGRNCRYTFSGSSGDVVTIRLEAISNGLDPYLDLLDPYDDLVASDDDSAGNYNSEIRYTLRRSGTYTIVAGSYGGGSAGSFELSLSVGGSTSSCGGSSDAGQTVTGKISSPGRDCRYTFSGSSGDVATILMEAISSGLDPYLDLLDPYGDVVASDDDSAGKGNSEIIYRLRRSGTYTIVAGSYGGDSAGSFELSLNGTGGSTASCGGNIRSGRTVDGEISSPGQDCRYTFSGSSGNMVTIRLEALSSGLDPYLDLLDPYGDVVASDDDSAGNHNSEIIYRLRRRGTYTIVAGSYGGGSTGSFELSLD